MEGTGRTWRHLASLLTAAIAVLAPTLLTAGDDATKLESRLATSTGLDRAGLLVQLVALDADNEPKKAIAYGREALALLTRQPDRTLETSVCNDLSWAYSIAGDYESARTFAGRAAGLAEKAGDRKALSRALRNQGNAELRLNHYDVALDRLDRALQISRADSDRNGQASALKFVGIVYDELGEYQRALDNYLKAQQIFEELAAWKDVATTLNNVGIIYHKMKDYDRALHCYQQALTAEESLGEKRAVSNTLNNMGVVQFDRGDYRSALELYRRTLPIEQELGSEWGLGIAYGNIGEALEKLGRHDEALREFQRALALAEKAEDQWGVASARRDIGSIHAALGHYQQAAVVTQEALALARQIKAKEVVRDCLESLAEIAEKRGDFRSALAYRKEFRSVQDQIVGEASQKQVAELRSRFEIASREREIELLKKDAAITEIDLRRSRVQSGALLAGLLLLGALVTVAIRGYRQQTRAAAVIRQQNEELTEAYRRLEDVSRTDTLTRLSNRGFVQEATRLEIARCERSHRPFAVVLSDIDDFKTFNDRHGHPCGDEVLRNVASLMRAMLRKQDVVGRWGGEEFIWLLPDTDQAGAEVVADRVRIAAAQSPVLFEGHSLSVTLTFGVAQHVPGMGLEECFKLADQALYAGKQAGKNRVVGAEPRA